MFLWELQGTRGAKFETVEDARPSKTEHKFVGFEQLTPAQNDCC